MLLLHLRADMFLVLSLILSEVNLLLNLLHIDVSHSILAVKDLGDLFQSRSLGLDVDEVDPQSTCWVYVTTEHIPYL